MRRAGRPRHPVQPDGGPARRAYAALTERTQALTESLQQTAIGEVLRVFCSSPTNIQPVLEAIVANGARLCGGQQCVLFGLDGMTLILPATRNCDPAGEAALWAAFPRPLAPDFAAGHAILKRTGADSSRSPGRERYRALARGPSAVVGRGAVADGERA